MGLSQIDGLIVLHFLALRNERASQPQTILKSLKPTEVTMPIAKGVREQPGNLAQRGKTPRRTYLIHLGTAEAHQWSLQVEDEHGLPGYVRPP